VISKFTLSAIANLPKNNFESKSQLKEMGSGYGTAIANLPKNNFESKSQP